VIRLLAFAALLPTAIGPLPQEQRTLSAGLCNGGAITIPLGDGDGMPARDCHLQGCHAGNCRERLDREQAKKPR
jgi:hypothetical protein